MYVIIQHFGPPRRFTLTLKVSDKELPRIRSIAQAILDIHNRFCDSYKSIRPAEPLVFDSIGVPMHSLTITTNKVAVLKCIEEYIHANAKTF